MGDINDATLGNPAIFQEQDILKKAQWGILRSVAFRPHLTIGLALYRRELSSQQGNYALLGAEHIHFKVL